MCKARNGMQWGIFCLLLIFRLTCPSAMAAAQEIKKPVFYLKYMTGQKFEEEDIVDEEDTELAVAINHQTASLRIKEQFSKRLTANLLFYFTRHDYLQESGSYTSFYVFPDLTYAFTDKLSLYTGLRTKWKYYDELATDGYVKDYINLALKTKLLFKPLKQLTLAPFVYSNFNLNENVLAKTQYYDFGLTITNKWEYFTLSGRYKGQASLPLGAESAVTTRMAHEFGINLTWDPN